MRAPSIILSICILSLLLHLSCAAPFNNPPRFASANGLLDLELDVALSTINLVGQQAQRVLYNATLNPPVLRVNQGDTFKLALINMLDAENTNIHWHGLAIAPVTGADKIFDEVAPNNTYAYNFIVPASHPVGTYWYHAHAMGSSESQVFSGLSGIFIVDPPTGAVIDRFPQLAGKQERVFPLRELVVTQPSRTQLINMQLNPTITIAPGDAEYWRIGNVGANNRYTITWPAGLSVVRVAADGHYLVNAVAVTSITLIPGARADIIVRGDIVGDYQITSEEEDMFGRLTGNGSPAALVTVSVTGTAITPVALPTTLAAQDDLSGLRLTRKRTFKLNSNSDQTEYYINGQLYDPTRIDVTVEVNDVEEWTIENLDVGDGTVSQQLHTFHMHQLAFQVMKIAGKSQEFNGYVDMVDVPPGESVVIRLFFNDPTVVGKFVFHCHVLKHEDAGMMAVLNLIPDDPTNNNSAHLASMAALVSVLAALLLLLA